MIQTTSLYDEVSQSYLLYSCSIFNRALPNIVDGLKTAQRRIILGLKDLGLQSSGAYKKVSRLEGHVLGSYHPNGGCAGTAINMGQCDAFRYPLTNIHGNVGGSIQVGERVGQCLDESPPAAARYLEIKSTSLTDEIFLKECDKHISEWRANYDGSTQEISYFVPSLPTLLLNGSTGIATGFAANHVPYNALEVINATIATLENPNITTSELRTYITAPDFPHYPRILDKNLDIVIETGSGSLELYGEWEFIEIPYKKKSKRNAIKIHSLASGNSEKFVEQTYKAIEEEKISGVAEVSNLSSRHGIEILVILKANTSHEEILPQLLKYTCLFDTIGVNATGLLPNENIPRRFGVKEIILNWYDYRSKGLVSRFKSNLLAYQQRLEVLEGFIIISNNIDRVMEIIKSSTTTSKAAELLSSEFNLTDLQTKAILDMSLKSLVKNEVSKLKSEKKELSSKVDKLTKLINSTNLLKKHIIKELTDLKELFSNDKRRTKVIKSIGKFTQPKQPKPTEPTLKDLIVSEGKELGMSSRDIKKFLEDNVGSGVKKAWESHKKNLKIQQEFITLEGRRQRKAKLDKLKQWALKNGLPTRGKRGWNAFMADKDKMPADLIKKEMDKWLTPASE